MRDALLLLVSLSLSGSALALAIYALRVPLRHKLSRTWQYYVWLVVVARLLMPFTPESSAVGWVMNGVQGEASAAVLTQGPPPAERPVESPPAQGTQIADLDPAAGELTAAPAIMASSEDPPSAPVASGAARTITVSWERILWTVWLLGAAGLLLWRVSGYLRFNRALRRTALPVEREDVLRLYAEVCAEAEVRCAPALLYTEMAAVPMLAGLLRPAIVLPAQPLEAERLRHVLHHELVHHKRWDTLYKWLVQLALCLHWFNPLVHLVSRDIARCCELACDEAVLRRVGGEEKYDYGETLLCSVRTLPRRPPAAVHVSLSEEYHMMHERLDSIKRFGGRSGAAKAASLLLTACLLCGAVFLGAWAAPAAAAAAGDAQPFSLFDFLKGGEEKAQATAAQSAAQPLPANPVLAVWEPDVRMPDTESFLPTQTVERIEIDVRGCGTAIRLVDADDFTVRYHSSFYTVAHRQEGGTVYIETRSRPGSDGVNANVAKLTVYLPNKLYTHVQVTAVDAAVSMRGLHADITMQVSDCASSLYLPLGYANTLRLNTHDSASSIDMPENMTDYTLTIEARDSAVSVPDGLPMVTRGRNYRQQVGNGAGQIIVSADDCAVGIRTNGERDGYDNYVDPEPVRAMARAAFSQIGADDFARLTLVEAPDGLRGWIAQCDRAEDLYVTAHEGQYYVYCNGMPGDFHWAPVMLADGSVEVRIVDAADSSGDGYALLRAPLARSIRVEYGTRMVQITEDTDKPDYAAQSDPAYERVARLYGYGSIVSGSYSQSVQERLHRGTGGADTREATVSYSGFTGGQAVYELYFDEPTVVSITLEADLEGDAWIAFLSDSDGVFLTASSYGGQRASRPVTFPAGRTTVAFVGEEATGETMLRLVVG